MSNYERPEYESDTFSLHIYDKIAVINLKNNVFNLAIDLGLKAKFFSLLDNVEFSSYVKTLLIINSPESLSDVSYRKFLRQIIREEYSEGTGYGLGKRTVMLNRHRNMLRQIILKLIGFRKGVIIAFRGNVAMTFLGAALACDLRLASDNVKFSQLYLDSAIPPIGVLGLFLPKYVGRGKAIDLLLSRKPLSANEANELGMINEVIASGEFKKRCMEKAKEIYYLPSKAILNVRALMHPFLDELYKYLDNEILLPENDHKKMVNYDVY